MPLNCNANLDLLNQDNRALVYHVEILFLKKMREYDAIKNQSHYFKQKNVILSAGKKQENKRSILKSLKRLNAFLAKEIGKNINKLINQVTNYDYQKLLVTLAQEFEPLLPGFKTEIYQKLLNNSTKSISGKKQALKIAKLNAHKRYKNSYNRYNRLKEGVQGYLFISPSIILLGIFMVFSIGFGLAMSFFKVKTTGGGLAWTFVGFDQYEYLFHSESFAKSLKVTLMYMIMVAPIQTLLSLVLSGILAGKVKGKKLFTVLYFLPTLTSSTALSIIFLRLFGAGGPFSQLLGGNFVNQHILGLIATMNIWTSIPYFMTIFNASLADIPRSQYEAASIDGASAIRKFCKITVPHLRYMISFVLLTSIIWTLQTFDQVYIIGKDPTLAIPSEDITTTAKWIYDAAFGSFIHQDFGRAAAGSIILAAIIFLFSYTANFVAKGKK